MPQRQNSCVEWRQKVSLMNANSVCPHSTYTHIWRTAKLSNQTHKHWMQNPSIRQLSQQANTTHFRWNCITATAANNFQLTFLRTNFGLANRLLSPFICVPTYMHNTKAHSCTQPNEQGKWRGGGIAQASRGLPWGHEWHTHRVHYTVCQPPIPETNTKHNANY